LLSTERENATGLRFWWEELGEVTGEVIDVGKSFSVPPGDFVGELGRRMRPGGVWFVDEFTPEVVVAVGLTGG